MDAKYELDKHLELGVALSCRFQAFQVQCLIELYNILLIHRPYANYLDILVEASFLLHHIQSTIDLFLVAMAALL